MGTKTELFEELDAIAGILEILETIPEDRREAVLDVAKVLASQAGKELVRPVLEEVADET